MVRAGTGVVVITPALGTPLAGHFAYRGAATIDDDLTARALVLDDGATRVALVVCDLIRVSGRTVARAREAIAERCGIPGERVMIAATHTHTGPVTYDGRGDPGERPMIAGADATADRRCDATTGLVVADADPGFLDWLAGRIADAVAVASARLAPARIAVGATGVEGVCFNRRYRMRDGTVVFNPPPGSPEVVGPVGPVDPQVTAMLVEDAAGVPIALWANLALHYVGTDDDRAISADYYGHFAAAVRRWLGEGCVGLLTNGASGDVNNRDLGRAVGTATTGARSRLVAATVAAAAVQATLTQRRREDVTVTAERTSLAVRRYPVGEEEVALAKAILAEPAGADRGQPAAFGFVVGQPIPADQRRTYAGEVLALAGMPAEGRTELQVMRIGELALVALPGEVFVRFGLAIKAASPFARTAVVGLANDHVGYLPTREAFAQGGYETWRTRISWTAPGTGEAMTETAIAQLRTMAERAPTAA